MDCLDSVKDFANWQFWVACLFVSAAVWFEKTLVGHASPPTLDKSWFKVLLTGSNLVWGLIVALPKGFLKGEELFERAMIGTGVGFFSHFAYHLVVKRFADKFGVNPPGFEVEPQHSRKKTDPEIKTGGP